MTALPWDRGRDPVRTPSPTGVFRPRPPVGARPGAGLGTIDVPSGWVQITSVMGDVPAFLAQLGEDGAEANTGDGQIERVEIPKRTARTVWQGRDPITLRIPFILDRFGDRRSVEGDLRNLDAMMGRGQSGTPREPTEVVIDANGAVPYDRRWQPDIVWWVEAVDLGVAVGDELIRRADWHRVKQTATVQLVQVVRGPTALRATAAASAREQLKRDSRLTVTVRKGETLTGIAKRVYGNASRWRDIATLNNRSHPKDVKPGQVLRLP